MTGAEDLDQPAEPALPSSEIETVDLTSDDPARERGQVRGWIALTLLGLFCLTVIFLLFTVTSGALALDGLEKIAAVLLSPITGLLGVAIGFYYGEHSRGR